MQAKLAAVAAMVAATLTLPRGAQAEEVPYHENDPIPAGSHVETRTRLDIALAGGFMLAVPYGLSVWIAAEFDFPNHSRWLLVPAAGPFITLGVRHGCGNGSGIECFPDQLLMIALGVDGVAQTIGAVALGAGLASTRSVLVRDDAALWIGPTRVGSGHGLGVVGRF